MYFLQKNSKTFAANIGNAVFPEIVLGTYYFPSKF